MAELVVAAIYWLITRKTVTAVWYPIQNPNASYLHPEILRVLRARAKNMAIKTVTLSPAQGQPIIVEAACVSNNYYAVRDALHNLPDPNLYRCNIAVIILRRVAPHLAEDQATSGRDLRRDYPEYDTLGLIVEFQVHDGKICQNTKNTMSAKLVVNFLSKFAA